jgi:hypothetical protein
MERYGELVHTESLLAKKEHQIFRALDNVAHDITGNAWKLRAIGFFFGWIERGGSLLQVFPIASRLHLPKRMEKQGTQEQFFDFLFLEGRAPPECVASLRG